MLMVTDWTEWTAIATFIAAGAAILLGLVTLGLVIVTRQMVGKASDEIKLERRRLEEASKPRVFPAPTGHWGDTSVYAGLQPGPGGPRQNPGGRNVLPVTNGGPGVALNVRAQFRGATGEHLVAETIPTSLGPDESRELVIKWQAEGIPGGQLRGLLHYYDISGVQWRTRFRIEEEDTRWLVEVQETDMISPQETDMISPSGQRG